MVGFVFVPITLPSESLICWPSSPSESSSDSSSEDSSSSENSAGLGGFLFGIIFIISCCSLIFLAKAAETFLPATVVVAAAPLPLLFGGKGFLPAAAATLPLLFGGVCFLSATCLDLGISPSSRDSLGFGGILSSIMLRFNVLNKILGVIINCSS